MKKGTKSVRVAELVGQCNQIASTSNRGHQLAPGRCLGCYRRTKTSRWHHMHHKGASPNKMPPRRTLTSNHINIVWPQPCCVMKKSAMAWAMVRWGTEDTVTMPPESLEVVPIGAIVVGRALCLHCPPQSKLEVATTIFVDCAPYPSYHQATEFPLLNLWE